MPDKRGAEVMEEKPVRAVDTFFSSDDRGAIGRKRGVGAALEESTDRAGPFSFPFTRDGGYEEAGTDRPRLRNEGYRVGPPLFPREGRNDGFLKDLSMVG